MSIQPQLFSEICVMVINLYFQNFRIKEINLILFSYGSMTYMSASGFIIRGATQVPKKYAMTAWECDSLLAQTKSNCKEKRKRYFRVTYKIHK